MEAGISRIKKAVEESERILVGLGGEWREEKNSGVMEAYDRLYGLVKEKDYFIVTTVTDGAIFRSSLDGKRITAPCGNIHWLQCEKACTKDIWEEGELADGICPHCKAPLVSNTIEAEAYIEEGYLPSWQAYTRWLTETLNRRLTVLELGVGFQTPTVIRWPFEKTVFFNQKSFLYRVNEKLYQKTQDIADRMESVTMNSVEFLRKF